MYLIASIALIHLVACLSPGPDIFLVALNSLRHGHRTGIATTGGILTGVCIQITVGITGVSFLVSQSAAVHAAMAIGGSLWLAWLGFSGLRQWRARHSTPSPGQSGRREPLPGRRAWRDGFLVNILNPKALLYFIGLFSVMLGPDVPLSLRMTSGLTMLVVQAVAFSAVAVLIDRPAFHDRWQPAQRALEGLLSIILLLLGTSICLTTLYSLLA